MISFPLCNVLVAESSLFFYEFFFEWWWERPKRKRETRENGERTRQERGRIPLNYFSHPRGESEWEILTTPVRSFLLQLLTDNDVTVVALFRFISGVFCVYPSEENLELFCTFLKLRNRLLHPTMYNWGQKFWVGLQGWRGEKLSRFVWASALLVPCWPNSWEGVCEQWFLSGLVGVRGSRLRTAHSWVCENIANFNSKDL